MDSPGVLDGRWLEGVDPYLLGSCGEIYRFPYSIGFGIGFLANSPTHALSFPAAESKTHERASRGSNPEMSTDRVTELPISSMGNSIVHVGKNLAILT